MQSPRSNPAHESKVQVRSPIDKVRFVRPVCLSVCLSVFCPLCSVLSSLSSSRCCLGLVFSWLVLSRMPRLSSTFLSCSVVLALLVMSCSCSVLSCLSCLFFVLSCASCPVCALFSFVSVLSCPVLARFLYVLCSF